MSIELFILFLYYPFNVHGINNDNLSLISDIYLLSFFSWLVSCYRLNVCVPQNVGEHQVEAPVLRMTVFRDRACEGVIRAKQGHKDEALI